MYFVYGNIAEMLLLLSEGMLMLVQSVPELAYQPLTTSSPLSSDENFTRNIFLKSIVYKLQQFYVSQS
jgi:hypothetical protein